MTKRSDEGAVTGALGGYAVGGAGLASASVLAGVLEDADDSRSRDLGPAPIGSDPWLHAQVRAAIARDGGASAAKVSVDVHDAIVTLRGVVAASDAARIECAARSVQGIKTLRVALTSV